MNLYLEPFKKYATFSGGASRAEFWVFNLVNFVIWIVTLSLAGGSLAVPKVVEVYAGLVMTFFLVSIIVPTIAMTVRRLHDAGLSGWLSLVGIIPFGFFVLFVLMVLDGNTIFK